MAITVPFACLDILTLQSIGMGMSACITTVNICHLTAP